MYLLELGSIFMCRYIHFYPRVRIRKFVIVSIMTGENLNQFRAFRGGEEVDRGIHCPSRFSEQEDAYEYVGNILGYSEEEILKFVQMLSGKDEVVCNFAKDVLMYNKKNMNKINANI